MKEVRFRAMAWPVGLAVVIALTLVLFVALTGDGDRQPSVRPASGATVAVLPGPAPALAAQPGAVFPSASRASAVPIIVDVCGVGPVEVASRADPFPARGGALAVPLQAALADLESSAKSTTHAIGLYYRAMLAAKAARTVAYTASTGCRDDNICSSNVQQIAAAAAQPFLQQLEAIASQGNDPAALALALNLCTEQAAGLHCDTRVTAARWARLEPDNAAAWMHVAAEATAHADPRGAADALASAAAAKRFDDYGRLLLAPIENFAVTSATPVERFHAQSDITSLWLSWSDAAYGQLTQRCLVDALDDRSRSACSSVAELITDESMMGRTIGIAIGRRTGWPAERVQALRAEQVRFEQALKAESPVDQAGRLTCSGLEYMQHFLTRRAHGGELAELRQRLAGTK